MIAIAGGIILAVAFLILLPWIWTAFSFAVGAVLILALIAGLCWAQLAILQDNKFIAVELVLMGIVGIWWYYERKARLQERSLNPIKPDKAP